MNISICMMVKNEEENLRRCLNSITPILQSIDSELIIVDTGSQDNTVEIAREYTDNIFFHDWENDFSDMRNKSISYAKGDWIFILDADEEVIDCNNIIQFLKSSKSKPFKTGLLNVKNIENLSDDSHYAMLKSPRLFRNDGEFHYEGIVHNNPIFKEPTVDLETIIVHYGYINENIDLANKKFIRTSNLLKKALEKEPNNIYYIFQLSVTYRSHRDYLDAFKKAKEAYELLDKCQDKNRYKYVYYQMALCAIDLQENEFAKKVCEEGLKLDNEYIDLMFYLAKTQGLTEEYEEAIETYKRYIYLCDNYDNMKINFNVTLGMYTIGQRDEALQDIVKIYFKLENFSEVLNFGCKIEKEKYVESVLELIVSSAVKLKDINYIKGFYEDKIKGNKKKEDKFFITLGQYYDESICKAFANYENSYSKLYFLRYKYNKNHKEFQNIVNEFLIEEDFNNLEDCFGDIVYYKLKYNSYLPKLLANVWEKNINRYLSYILKNYEDFSEVLINYINNFKDNVDTDNMRINKILCKYVLLIDKIDNFEYEEIFKYYLDIGVKWINYNYNKRLVADECINIFKSEEEKFFVYMSIAVANKDDKKLYVRYLRNAITEYPYMKKGIETLLENLKNEINLVNNEFEHYKVQVKNTIRNYVENGQLIQAEEIINEYGKIVQDDIEIYSMKTIIAIMHGEFERAEQIIKKGLTIDNKNFDLLYNLAYIFQLKNEKEKSIQTYENLLKEITSLEIAEQIQNNIIILDKKLNYNENIFLNLRKYEYDFISSLNRVNKDIVYKYIEYLINKYCDLKEFFFDIIVNNLNTQNDIKNNLIYVEICKALLKLEYKEEIYSAYNAFIIKYVNKTYNCKNLDKFYDFIENKEEKIKIVIYLLNEAIENKKYDIFNSSLDSLIKLCSCVELKHATKEFFSEKMNL